MSMRGVKIVGQTTAKIVPSNKIKNIKLLYMAAGITASA